MCAYSLLGRFSPSWTSGALPIIFRVSREKRFEKSNIGPQLRDLLARNIVAVLMDRHRTRFERAQKLEQCG